MSDARQPVIVNTEAFPKEIATASQKDIGFESLELRDSPPIETVDAETAMRNILAALKDAEAKSDGKVLTAPHEGHWAAPAARFQSLIASGQVMEMKYEPVASGGLEAQYDTGDWIGDWIG